MAPAERSVGHPQDSQTARHVAAVTVLALLEEYMPCVVQYMVHAHLGRRQAMLVAKSSKDERLTAIEGAGSVVHTGRHGTAPFGAPLAHHCLLPPKRPVYPQRSKPGIPPALCGVTPVHCDRAQGVMLRLNGSKVPALSLKQHPRQILELISMQVPQPGHIVTQHHLST